MNSPPVTGSGPDESRAQPDFERIALLLQGGGALGALPWGAPNFVKPRLPPPIFLPAGNPGNLAFYDTAPLKTLTPGLSEVVFDYLAK